jgi:L-lactate utilization protein LutC
MFRVDFTEHTGTPVIVYGQTEVTRDLYAAREAAGGQIDNADDVVIHDADTDAPHVTYTRHGVSRSGSIAISSRAATGFTGSAASHHSAGCAAGIRKGLSLWLAWHPVGNPACQR